MTRKLYLETPYETSFEATILGVNDNQILLNQSLFYPTSGGQPGDNGFIRASDQKIAVLNTIKDKEHDTVLHVLAEGAPLPRVGDKIQAEIDWDTRYKHMRMHTTMHLLCSLIEGYATGGQIGADKSRLDFDVPAAAYTKEDLTDRLNHLIAQDHPITTSWITDEELEANPHLIRTMSVKPPMGTGRVRVVQIGTTENRIDFQPCGGTHVKNTGEIGKVHISKIENKGKQNRRFHIVFGEGS